MKKIIIPFLSALLIVSCASDKKGAMLVQGTIKGLQKGTLHLQKFQDTVFVSVDSMNLNGANTFVLSYDIKEPEVFYLTLDKKEDEKIEFFGEEGVITINSKLEKFSTSAKVSGSKLNDILIQYNEMMSQFNGKNLDLLKESFEAQRDNDDELLNKVNGDIDRLEKNRIRFSTTFAIRNADNEVAPFIALSDLYNAHISLLDTVNNSLSSKVKSSKYGIKLDEYIKEIKAQEVN